MTSEFTVTRISRKTLEAIRARAELNHRTVPSELDAMLDTVESGDLAALGIVKIETLPHPDGAQEVPVVYMRGNGHNQKG